MSLSRRDPEAASALKSFDRIPDSPAGLPLAVAEELQRVGLAYGSSIGGAVNMTVAGRLWLIQCTGQPAQLESGSSRVNDARRTGLTLRHARDLARSLPVGPGILPLRPRGSDGRSTMSARHRAGRFRPRIRKSPIRPEGVRSRGSRRIHRRRRRIGQSRNKPSLTPPGMRPRAGGPLRGSAVCARGRHVDCMVPVVSAAVRSAAFAATSSAASWVRRTTSTA